MGIPAATHQAAADAIKALGTWIGVHTAAAGTTGASEASGGSYARRQTTWTSNSNGTVSGSTVNVPVPAGSYTEGSIWSAQTAGTFVGSGAFSGGTVTVSGTGASIDVTPSLAA
jgi:hypothetical protein